MAWLYFRYGAVSSAKTLNLLAVAHQYETQGKRVAVLKPSVDTRYGERTVASRAGLDREADLVVEDDTVLDLASFEDLDALLVDEAQFLSESLVDQLRELTRALRIPVICYGLRTDFRSHLFEGSRRLMEVADSIEEVKTTCSQCTSKAILNLKLSGGRPTLDGPVVELGLGERYQPVCYRHYTESLHGRQSPAGSPAVIEPAD